MSDSLNIIIVEDSATQAASLRQILEKQGHRIRVAVNGRAALDEIAAGKPDVLITDIIMPEMDGYELCRTVKSDDNLKDIPVMLLTSLSSPADVLKALQNGADNFITKPVNEEFLGSRIASILANRDMRNQAGSENGKGTRLIYGNETHEVNSGLFQVTELLISTYEGAILKNRELQDANLELRKIRTKLEAANRELKSMVNLDGLTFIANRKYFDEYLEDKVNKCRREGTGLGLLMLDIDFFKNYNDSLGHLAGDEALKKISRVLKAVAAEIGFTARYGGEEFAVVLEDVSEAVVRATAERIRVQVAELGIEHPASSVANHVTVSIGAALMTPEADDRPEKWIRAADDRLYDAKDGGRNQFRL